VSFAILAAPVTGAGVCVPAGSVEERASRLAWELADLLNDYGDGTSYAVVHPSAREEFAVAILKALPV
jgi:hypothetical protein